MKQTDKINEIYKTGRTLFVVAAVTFFLLGLFIGFLAGATYPRENPKPEVKPRSVVQLLREQHKDELTPDKKLCDTNKADNEIYVIDCNDAPNVLQEIGRLREIAFRDSGGGTGQAVDLDEFDPDPVHPYKQLIIWDPEASDSSDSSSSFSLSSNSPRLSTGHGFVSRLLFGSGPQ